ncbi:hypothetical protein CONPUDRAFT_141671 [Coniophora puteana RWD-64-598 SS2]|uniref:DUF7702 domain-containing protein n=1 Tax=Coniophora puteana (strain RWD-64-598) TaxID=741705 RepID=A0A5M3N1R7_CONPW|nr:uncharacterized protein CONPUDRAFT_141671 [Coniophora puteana RWD-64-598 SS2]EIW84821.1 hypothetical protein CONPUDRAFT_141671 [Coniophora puteana RWD-64-598 SS2]
MPSAGENYAVYSSMYSLAGAVVFAIVYFLLFFAFVFKAISRPTYVHFMLAFFCIIRICAFVIRALLIKEESIGENLNVFIAYQIIYNVGFFGILYSAYTLVLDRMSFAKRRPNGPISMLLSRPFLFRIALSAGIALGIAGASIAATATKASTASTGSTLREAAVYIFLALSALVFLQTIFLARAESSDGTYKQTMDGFGAQNGAFILALISLLLVAREAFFTATIHNTSEQNNEKLWYPLSALTELVAVILFLIPGLVPARKEIRDNNY